MKSSSLPRIHHRRRRSRHTLWLIILVILVLALLQQGMGIYPSGGVGLILVILITLYLTGYLRF